MRDGYFGDTVIWPLRDENDRRTYLTYRRREFGALSLVVLSTLLASCIVLMILRSTSSILFPVVLAPFLFQVYRTHVERKYSLTSVELRLFPKKFELTECYGPPHYWRDRTTQSHFAKHLRSLHWGARGCQVDFKSTVLMQRPVVLPMGLFSSQEAIDALHRWADAHGVPVDGIPPLPGAYLRPVEGPAP